MMEIAINGKNATILQRNALQDKATASVTTSAMSGNIAKQRKLIFVLQKQTGAVQMQIAASGRFVQVPITAMPSSDTATMTMIV